MARNAALGKGRQTVSSGAGSLQLPEYITVSTGKHSKKEDNVQVVTQKGNTIAPPVYSPWNTMFGVRVSYEKDKKYITTTIYDDNEVQIRSTGAWKVEVELPRE